MASMAYTRDRGNRSGGGNRNFGKPRFNNDRQEMYSATCANCGKQCEVPFRPTGSKPVLCRECFQNNRSSDSRRSEERFDRQPSNRSNNAPDYTTQFEQLNAKLNRILDMLTQRTVDVSPIESSLNEKVIEDIVGEIQEEKEASEEKPKRAKTTRKKNNPL